MSLDQIHTKVISLLQYVAGIALLAYATYAYVMTQRVISIGNHMMVPDSGPPLALPTLANLIFVAMFIAPLFMIASGYCLQVNRGYWFCIVVAAAECLYVPIGTALGFLTILILLRPSVTARFMAHPATPSTSDE